MHFPVAGIDVNPLVPPLVAFVISFFTSMGGVSGAFLILPFQVSVLGFTSPAVSPTNQLYNIVSIPSGVYRYIREGRMLWPLTWTVIVGTLPGVVIGALLRIWYLPNPRDFKLFVGLVLLYLGGRLLGDVLGKKGREGVGSMIDREPGGVLGNPVDQTRAGADQSRSSRVIVRRWTALQIIYDFRGQTFSVNNIGLVTLSLLVGIIGGAYGIGGGAIIAPFLVSVLHLPVYTVAGAALTGTFVTSIVGVCFYQLIAPFYPGLVVAPDWGLGLLFGIGGFAGMYCGARVQRFVPEKVIKWILLVCILVTSVKYVVDFFW